MDNQRSWVAGDRHFRKSRDPGARKIPRADAEVTLIELEALVALERDCHIALEPGAHRRNITCRGVRLSGLVGAPFQVGEVILRGVKLSQPCAHLESLTQPGVVKGLIHRAGLRAEILRGGVIRRGDRISRPRCSRVPHEPVGVSVPG